MTDPIQEGQAFAAAVFGRGPTEPEQPAEKVPNQDPNPEPETPAEDGLITALRQRGKPWQAELVRLLHPPDDEDKG